MHMKNTLAITLLLWTATAFSQIADSAFSFEASYVGDNYYNMVGGIDQNYTYLGMADIFVGFSTENAKLWKGGEFMIHGQNTHGGTPSAALTGDMQVASNIENGDNTHLYELWYSQSIGKLQIIAGLQDANAELVASEYGGHFLNSSFGIIPTVVDNTAPPIFPLTGLGLTAIIDISENLVFKTALYDGTLTDFDENPYNIEWSLSAEEGFTSFSELEIKKSFLKEKEASYKLGFHFHQHDEDNIDVTAETISKYGLYAIADQQLIVNEAKGQALGAFAQFGYSPKEGGNNYMYIGAGLHYRGLFNRTDDEFGIAVASASFDESGTESTIETTYKAQITESIALKPCLQYVINPGGEYSEIDNALAGILRIEIGF